MLSIIPVLPHSKVAAGEKGSEQRTTGKMETEMPSFSPVFNEFVGPS
jgi:hypothetical protein